MANWVASREGSGRTGKESGREGCHAVGNGLAVHGSDALGMRCKAVHRARECVRRVSRAEGARAAGIAARGGPPYFFRVAEFVETTPKMIVTSRKRASRKRHCGGTARLSHAAKTVTKMMSCDAVLKRDALLKLVPAQHSHMARDDT